MHFNYEALNNSFRRSIPIRDSFKRSNKREWSQTRSEYVRADTTRKNRTCTRG